jgi:hypothetical protein
MDVNWCVRGLPKDLRTLAEKHGKELVIAGGYIRSKITNETVNDIDVFAGSPEKAESLAKELVMDKNGRFLKKTKNAITVFGINPIVQFVHRWTFDEPRAVVESFDFTIARAAIWFENKLWQGICCEQFYPDLAARRLVYCSPVRNEDAGGSMLRVLKFYQRGYRIPLDSLGAVLARLVRGVNFKESKANSEEGLAEVLTGLLIEVDPNIAVPTAAHLPPTGEESTEDDSEREDV